MRFETGGRVKKINLLLPMVLISGLLLSNCSKSYDEYLNLGNSSKSSEAYVEALEMYQKAIDKAETAEQRINANIMAGNLAGKNLHDYDKADAFYRAALKDASDYSPGDLRDLAKQALAAQANKAAVEMYELWISNNKDNADLLDVKYEYAEVFHKNIRDLKNAIKAYGDIVDNHPDSEQAPKALFSMGYIYANELAENENASKYYSKFLATYPDHEMAPSVEFELKYLGKSLEEIPELQHLLSKTS